MATYNPLNDFNTYSYHHFLVLVSTTAAADKLKDSALFFRFATGQEQIEGAYIVVNPIKSLRYTIDNLTWTNWLATNYDQFGGTVGSGGDFTIIEPNGMSFMNDLFDAFKTLQCGMSTSQWVLKTMFVGQTNVGGTGPSSVEYVNNINPLLMVIVDVEASFSERGGEYVFKFAAAGSGAGLMPGPNSSGFSRNATINLASGDKAGAVTLEQGLRQVERHLNEGAKQTAEDFDKIRQMQSTPIPQPKAVEYKFDIDPALLKPEYIISTPKRTGAGPDGSAPMLSVSTGTGIPTACMKVIKMCPQLMEDSNKPNQKREHYVDSSKVEEADKTVFWYYIKERAIETIADSAARDGGTNTGDIPIAEQVAIDRGNFMEFDYLYTGKNLDVLNFDMKLGAGLAFMQSMVNVAGIKDDRSHPTKAQTLTSASNAVETGTGTAPPQSNPNVASSTAIHSTNPSGVSAYEQLLQQHSILNVLATIKIRGNTRLLNDAIPTVSADGTRDSKTSMGVMASYGTQPVRCRVNIRMPKDGDLENLQNFWYQGTYLIMSVTNNFSDGEFTQDIQMVAEMDGMYQNIIEPKQQPAQVPVPPMIIGEVGDAESRIRAFLSMIRYCEGTAGENGYNIIFSGVPFTDMSDHPRQVIVTPKYKSSAAGAYQIIQPTWDTTLSSSKYKQYLPDFSPVSQDMAGWCLLDYRKALPAIREGRIADAINLCKLEWASLPGSTYGQPTKQLNQALSVYNTFLQQELNGESMIKAPKGMLV